MTQHFCLFPAALFLFGPVFTLFRPVVIRKGIISGKLFLTKMTRVRMMRMIRVDDDKGDDEDDDGEDDDEDNGEDDDEDDEVHESSPG